MDAYLPFLAVHGPLFWRLLVIVFAVLVIVAIWTLRYLFAARRARRGVREVRANHGSIAGVLRGGDVTTLSLTSTTNVEGKASWRSESLWLETADRKIELVGPIEVVAGSHFRGGRRWKHGIPAGREERVAEAVPWASERTAIALALAVGVSAGDQVEVRGTASPRAGRGEATPREAAIEWSAGGGETPLTIAAAAPVAARVPLGWVRAGIAIGAALITGTIATRALGEHWEEQCRSIDADDLDPHAPLAFDDDHPCVLAASVPKSRDYGIHRIHSLLERHPYRDAASVARLDTFDAERDSCEQPPDSYYVLRFEHAIERARRCGDRRTEHLALVALGRFDEAAAVSVPRIEGSPELLPSPSTLIAAGRWREAAHAFRTQIAEAEQRYGDEYREHHFYQRCVADWLDHLGGEHAATARLQRLAADPESPSAVRCAPVLSELEPERRKVWLAPRQGIYSTALSVLRHEAGMLDVTNLSFADEFLRRPDGRDEEILAMWNPRLGASPNERSWRAAKQVLDNDVTGALATARDIVAGWDTWRAANPHNYIAEYGEPALLIPSIQLFTPTIFDLKIPDAPGQLWGYRYGNLALRSRAPIDKLDLSHSEDHNQTYRIARSGDGKALLERLRPYRVGLDDIELLAVLPHITRDREAIARELPYLRLSLYMERGILKNAIAAFLRRELFEALGDTENAKRWDAMYRRADAVLRDDQKRIALILADFPR